MKQLITLILILFCVNSYAQVNLFLGESDSISTYYSKDVNDSLISAKHNNRTIYSKWIKVYSDKTKSQCLYESIVVNDTTKIFNYWENGKIKTKNYWLKDSSIDHYTWIYEQVCCRNGQLIRNSQPNSKKRKTVKNYYCNGQQMNEFTKVDRIIDDGKTSWWTESGKLKSEFHYKLGVKVGDWKYWNHDNISLTIEHYDNGKLMSTDFYENGEHLGTK